MLTHRQPENTQPSYSFCKTTHQSHLLHPFRLPQNPLLTNILQKYYNARLAGMVLARYFYSTGKEKYANYQPISSQRSSKTCLCEQSTCTGSLPTKTWRVHPCLHHNP